MSRKNRTRSPQNASETDPKSRQTATVSKQAPRGPDPIAAGLGEVEASFRSLVEHAEGSLRKQTEAFDSMLQTAQVALRERAALNEEKQSLQSTIATLNGDCATVKRALEQTRNERTALAAEQEAQSVQIAALQARCEEQHARADRAEQERDTHRGDLEVIRKEREALLTDQKEQAVAIAGLRSRCEEQHARADRAEQERDTHRADLGVMRKEREELLNDQKAQSVAIAAMKTANEELVSRAESAEHERATLRKKRDQLQKDLAELTVRCGAAECDRDELQGVRTELEAARDALQAQLNEANEETRIWTDRASTAEQARDELTARCAKLDQHVAESTTQHADLSKLLARVESERDRSTVEVERLTATVHELTKERDVLAEQVEVASQEQTKVQGARQSLESCLSELMSKCEELESDRKAPEINAEAEKELERLRREATQLRSKCASLEHKLESAEQRHAVGEGADVAVARVLSAQVSGAGQLVDDLREAKMPEDLRKHLLGRAVDMFTHLSAAAGIAVASDEEDTIALEPKPVDVRALIGETVTRLSAVPMGKNLPLRTNVDAHLPSHVGVDEARLEQLICWCIDYTRRFAAQDEVVVGASIDKETGNLRISVYNDGAGMSTDLTEVALDRRKGTGPEAAQRRTELSGFRHLAERMGGELRLEAVGSLGFAATVLVGIEKDDRNPDDRRDDDRVLLQMLQCNLGPIVDLSPTGVRIRCTKPLKNRVNIDIPFEGKRIKLKADALWGKQVNRKEFEYGLRFVTVGLEQEQQLRRLAKRHGFRPAA